MIPFIPDKLFGSPDKSGKKLPVGGGYDHPDDVALSLSECRRDTVGLVVHYFYHLPDRFLHLIADPGMIRQGSGDRRGSGVQLSGNIRYRAEEHTSELQSRG